VRQLVHTPILIYYRVSESPNFVEFSIFSMALANQQTIESRVNKVHREQRERGGTSMKTYDFIKGKRGPVLPVPPGKERITIRLDADILEYFRGQVKRARGRQLPKP